MKSIKRSTLDVGNPARDAMPVVKIPVNNTLADVNT